MGSRRNSLRGGNIMLITTASPPHRPPNPPRPFIWAIAVPWCTRLTEAWSSRVPVCTTNLCTGRRDDNSTTRYPVPLSNPIQITLFNATAAHEMKLLAAGTLLAQIAEMCWTLELYHVSLGARECSTAPLPLSSRSLGVGNRHSLRLGLHKHRELRVRLEID